VNFKFARANILFTPSKIRIWAATECGGVVVATERFLQDRHLDIWDRLRQFREKIKFDKFSPRMGRGRDGVWALTPNRLAKTFGDPTYDLTL